MENNSLETVKRLLSEGRITQDVAEEIFPELKESEDERIRNRIIGYLKQDIEEHPERKERIEDMLAWLEKQGSQNLANSAKTCMDEQHPAWSEEDERNINGILMVLESWDRYHVSSAGLPSLIPQYISWLKSLKERYTWKPSDEQLDGIKCAIKTLQYQLNVGDKRLDSLYGDLKKLKG